MKSVDIKYSMSNVVYFMCAKCKYTMRTIGYTYIQAGPKNGYPVSFLSLDSIKMMCGCGCLHRSWSES